MDRRIFIKSTAVAGAASWVLGASAFPQFTNGGMYPYASEMPSFTQDALEPYIDKETMRIHSTLHHPAYTRNLNLALDKAPDWQTKPLTDLFSKLSDLPQPLQNAIRNFGGGHWNHNFFWKCLSPDKPKISEKLLQKINADFGSYTAFQEQFNQKATSVFGSGWSWLILKDNKLMITTTPNQENPLMNTSVMGKPLLALDVWEHAYYLKYQNRRAEYLTAWWSVVNWDFVGNQLP
jgi:Fe-Mn family superoxide dismutase